MLLATEAGLGNGETPIFPVQIFRVKEGVNYNPGRPELRPVQAGHALLAPSACSRTSASWTRRSTCKYYKPARPETEIAYMGCRTRVMGNVYDPDREIDAGPRQPVASPPSTCRAWPSSAKGDIELFFEACWTRKLDAGDRPAGRALRDPGAQEACTTSPFLMGQGVWIDSEKLAPGRRAARGAQARHADHGLHRPGRSAWWRLPASTMASRARRRTWAWRSSATCAATLTGMSQERGMNYTLHRHAGRGPVRPLRAHGPRPLRRHPRRDRPRLLHQRLPRAGVLPHLRLRQDQRWRRPTTRSPTRGHISYVELDGDPTENLEAFESGHPLHEGLRHGLRLGEPPGRPRPGVRLQRHHRATCAPSAAAPRRSTACPSSASAASPAIWWARSTASTTPSAPKRATVSSIPFRRLSGRRDYPAT